MQMSDREQMKERTSCPRGTRAGCTEPWRTWERNKKAVIDEKSEYLEENRSL